MLPEILLILVLYVVHLFLKWFLSDKRGRWATITLFVFHRLAYLVLYLFNWVLFIYALVEHRYDFFLGLCFTFPLAAYVGAVCLHDLGMSQKMQWYPILGRYYILFKWKIIKWHYHDKDNFRPSVNN